MLFNIPESQRVYTLNAPITVEAYLTVRREIYKVQNAGAKIIPGKYNAYELFLPEGTRLEVIRLVTDRYGSTVRIRIHSCPFANFNKIQFYTSVQLLEQMNVD